MSALKQDVIELVQLNSTIPPRKQSNKFLQLIKRRIYIVNWIQEYDRTKFLADLIAGFTIGLMIIPQSLAYASLAEVPSQYGLYSAFMGSIVYVFFGTVKEVSIGTSSLMAILTLQFTIGKPIEYVILLTFLCGCVELLMGVFKLGFIVDFIPVPVVSAFTSATSLIIIGAQMKSLLGIKYAAKGFFNTIIQLFKHITEAKLGDSLLGIAGIVFLIVLRKLKDIPITSEKTSMRILKKFLWYLSISRNALIVLISGAIAYYWSEKYSLNELPFKLSGKVEPGIPSFQLPDFSLEINNKTVGFIEICEDLGSGIILVPLVSVLANVAIAKSFASVKIVDASKEMIALGLANIFGSFFKSMPSCGAFTRSAVSHASGVATPMAGIYSAIMTLLSLSLLTPYFYFIPKTTLAAVLICAVFFMIDFSIISKLWKESKHDLISWAGCIVGCILLGVEVGLMFGIALSVLYILFLWARPKTVVKIEKHNHQNIIRVCPNGGLLFPGIDNLREQISRASIETDYKVPIILDCCKISRLDYTAVKGLENLAGEMIKHKQTLILQNMDLKLQKCLDSSHFIFCTREDAVDEILSQLVVKK
ncbi:unnamed protein product [Diamesa tonsa]